MPNLNLVTVLVPDYDDAIEFYVGHMGFVLEEDSAIGAGKRWVVVRPGGEGAGLLLAEAATDEQRAWIGDQTGGRVFLFLHTDDFERDRSRFLRAGVRFVEEPRHEPYGTVAQFEDRYGNRWDLIQPRG